jgi:serine protease AprX
MAGLIAGNGASSGGKVMGAAPGANLVAIKVAGFDGSTDVAQILAGVQWAVAHKDVYNIRVLNLSLGTDSAQDYRISPLNYAVERAWDAGIAVVVSAGNSGPDGGTMMKPGDDPFVITVGASDEQGSVPIKDDRAGVFSSRGPTRSNGLAKPDLVAPGVHTISLRSPGSNIDQQFGSTATVGGSYFKGTGTSMSTAVVSGIAAQVLQANPGLNPNQVKYRLMETARPIADTDPMKIGRGLVDAGAATNGTLINGSANVGVTPSLGVGLIDADRGTAAVDVDTAVGMVTLAGEFVGQIDPENTDPTNLGGFMPWLGSAWRTDGWDVSSWPGSAWRGSAWRGSAWRGSAWRQTEWDGSAWRGSAWRNEDWEGSAWRGSAWRGMDWSGSAWRGSSWQTAWYAAAWD